jgi:hypothetical protein
MAFLKIILILFLSLNLFCEDKKSSDDLFRLDDGRVVVLINPIRVRITVITIDWYTNKSTRHISDLKIPVQDLLQITKLTKEGLKFYMDNGYYGILLISRMD